MKAGGGTAFSSVCFATFAVLLVFSPILAVLPNKPMLAVEATFPNNEDAGVGVLNVAAGAGEGGVVLAVLADKGANVENGFFFAGTSSFFSAAAGGAVAGVEPKVNLGGAAGVVEVPPKSPNGVPAGVLLKLANGLFLTGDGFAAGAGDPAGVPPPLSAPNPANGLTGEAPKSPPDVPFAGGGPAGVEEVIEEALKAGGVLLKPKPSTGAGTGAVGREAAGAPAEKRDFGCLIL